MSVRLMSHVWESSAAKGIDRLVLLAIADSANDDTHEAWPSVATLARKTAVDSRTVQRSIRSLVDLGELVVSEGRGRRGSNLYRLLDPRQAATPSGNVTPLAERRTPRQAATPAERQDPRQAATTPPGRESPPPWQSATQSVREPTTRTVSRPRQRGTRLAEDWKPDAAAVAWQREQGIPDALARRELPRFVDYWTAKAGKDGAKIDWVATWRNWLRRSMDHEPRSSAPSARPTGGGW